MGLAPPFGKPRAAYVFNFYSEQNSLSDQNAWPDSAAIALRNSDMQWRSQGNIDGRARNGGGGGGLLQAISVSMV